MVLPLLIPFLVPIILAVLFFILVLPTIIGAIKLMFIVVFIAALVWFLYSRVHKRKDHNIQPWEILTLGVALFGAYLAIGGEFSFFTITRMPLAVQQSISSNVSPLTVWLGITVVVLAVMYFRKSHKVRR